MRSLAPQLRSNQGHSELTLDLGESVEYANEPGFQAILYLRGQVFDGEAAYPVLANLEGLWLRGQALAALRRHLTQWLRQPLALLVSEDITAEFELCSLPDQRLLLRFQPDPEAPATAKIRVEAQCRAGNLQVSLTFVADPTGLSLFANELPN